MIEVRDLTVRLGGTRRWFGKSEPPVIAVNRVNLSIQQGEVLALVGESGSGKTTLGRTILGLQRESAGEIRLNGRVVSGLAPGEARRTRSDIQYVHQDAAAALDPAWRSTACGQRRSVVKRSMRCWSRSAWNLTLDAGTRTNFPAVSSAASHWRASCCCARSC